MDHSFRNFLAIMMLVALIVGVVIGSELVSRPTFKQKCSSNQGVVYTRPGSDGKVNQLCIVNGVVVHP